MKNNVIYIVTNFDMVSEIKETFFTTWDTIFIWVKKKKKN